MGNRVPLTVARILEASAAVADRGGIVAVTMRNVGRELGVEAMSLYHHIASKDALLDALTDWVFGQIDLPEEGVPWQEGLRQHATSARSILHTHPWALALVESRSSPGPAVMRRHDAVLGCLRRGGFSIRLASRAHTVVNSYTYGFVLTEHNLPFDTESTSHDYGTEDALIDYPHLADVIRDQRQLGEPSSFAAEFARGLDLIIEALEQQLVSSQSMV